MNTHPALRLFTCVKTRSDDRPSCGAAGAAEIISALRKELANRGTPAAHIDVRPCDCVDRCEDGPVLLGFTGRIAEEAQPPRGHLTALLHRPQFTFKKVYLEQVPAIVDRLLEDKKWKVPCAF